MNCHDVNITQHCNWNMEWECTSWTFN